MHMRKMAAALVPLLVVGAGLIVGTSAASASVVGFPSGPFNIYNPHAGWCLAVDSSNNAVLGGCGSSDPSSVWYAVAGHTYGGVDYHQLVNGLGECLGLSKGSTALGTQLVAKLDCNNNGDQFWVLGTPSGQSFDSLLNYKADMAAQCVGCGGDVGVQHSGTQPGDLVRLSPHNNNGDQTWNV